MSNEAPSYVTDEMRAAQGQWGGVRTAPPITATDIRRWAMATYYPKQPPRIYWDSDYRVINQKNDVLTVVGEVSEKSVVDGENRVRLDVNVVNQDGGATCPGHAVVVLP